MKRIYYKYLALSIISIVFCSCGSLLNPPNDDNIYISGQYVIEENGVYVPFVNKVRCDIEVTYNMQEWYPTTSTYSGTFILYSKGDGSFEYEINDVGSYKINLWSFYIQGDTIQYYNDTTMIFYNGTPQNNVMLPLTMRHIFDCKITPKRFTPSDSITLTINHDALVLVEACDYMTIIGADTIKFPAFQKFEVDKKQSFTFKIDEDKLFGKEMLYLKFTTQHYGTYIAPFVRIYDN